jgi:methyl-accepting chemotaxis protein
MLKKFGLQKYLLVVILLIIFISFLSSLFTVVFTQKSIGELKANTVKTSAISNSIISLTIDISSIHSSLSSLITEKDPDILEASIAKVKKSFEEIGTDLKKCQFDCTKMESLFKDYQTKVNELIDQRILLGKTAEAIEFFIQDLSPVYFKTLTELEEKGELIKKISFDSIKTADDQGEKLKITVTASSLFMILLIGVAGLNFRKNLVSSIKQIAEQLQSSTITLEETSRGVAATSEFLSESSVEQNATVQGTSQAVQEISSMTEINRNNVTGSATKARASLQQIGEGKEAIKIMMDTIKKIADSNADMISQINKNETEFSEVTNLIKEIDSKTKIINDIVFQTKLLSFNASVEAARAGEHGKGFAVVAEEIGNLAVMSGQAANEISSLLNNSVKRVNDIVTTSQGAMVGIMESGKVTITEGNSAVENCQHIFDKISLDSQSISTMLEEINAGTTEQSKGIEEVNKSMLQINDVANKNAQVAQDSQSMAEKLKEQSNSIALVTEDLTVMLNGKKA